MERPMDKRKRSKSLHDYRFMEKEEIRRPEPESDKLYRVHFELFFSHNPHLMAVWSGKVKSHCVKHALALSMHNSAKADMKMVRSEIRLKISDMLLASFGTRSDELAERMFMWVIQGMSPLEKPTKFCTPEGIFYGSYKPHQYITDMSILKKLQAELMDLVTPLHEVICMVNRTWEALLLELESRCEVRTGLPAAREILI